VLVVGAGPAGSTVAAQLARKGWSVQMVEEHARVGLPVQCAGLVSQRVLDLAGPGDYLRTPVRGAAVFGPSLQSVSFRAAEPRAFVIDRAGLDAHLADRAARAGVTIRCSTRFDGRAPGPAGTSEVRLTGPDGEKLAVRARLVIGADGVTSAVARSFRLRRPVEILPAFEAEFARSPGDPEIVEVYLGRLLSPGLFGWWIPDGAGGARVGVAVDADGTSARLYFERLVAHLARRFGGPLPAPTAYIASGIPIGTVPHTVADGVLLVGDAAAQVKPLSGGGIFTGMRCALLAADAADRALRSGDLTAAALRPYEQAWRGEFGEEFRRALYLRRVFQRLSDDDLDRVIGALQGSELAGTIVAFGDIDFPTHVARRLLRQSPSLVRLLPRALGAWVSPSDGVVPDLDFDGRSAR
jgi:digeranylgeranylglycerophospholipid reductase